MVKPRAVGEPAAAAVLARSRMEIQAEIEGEVPSTSVLVQGEVDHVAEDQCSSSSRFQAF